MLPDSALIDKLRRFLGRFISGCIVALTKLSKLVQGRNQRAQKKTSQPSVLEQSDELATVPVVVRRNGRGEDPANEDATVSVIIPVKDAGDEFSTLLSSLTGQKGFKKLDIVVVDSGSSDRSVDVAREFGAKVLQIAPEEFSHSYARNLAADHSSGDYLLFTVQDALPTSDIWLYELFSVLRDNNVAAVSCAETPRDDADLFYRASSWNHYRFLEIDQGDRILSQPKTESYFTLRKNAPLSNLACLIKRRLFLDYKFRGRFAEDLELGLRLIRDGHKLAILNAPRVIHSHNRPSYYHLKRGYADALLLCDIFPDVPIAAMDSSRLMQDILHTARGVDSLVEELAHIEEGSLVSNISQIVMTHYRTWSAGNYSLTVTAQTNTHADPGFYLFLEKVHRHFISNGDTKERKYDGVLLDAMQGATGTILSYMSTFYEKVDETLLDEFRSTLYKIFAFQCGCYLASSYARGSAPIRQDLDTFNRELTQGV